jgi:6-phosphofructokinase 1
MVLKGNAIVAQSGGPTAVINASACGVVQECLKHSAIEGIYGAINGVLGILNEEIFDFREESPSDIEGLKYTPAAALGSCRYKLKSIEDSREDYNRIMEVFQAHNIRYFFYIGGNDSMDTADKIGFLAKEMDYEMRVMGIPKTVDNDLAFTDHCPGYGSVAKFNAVAVMEAGRDTDAIYTADTCTIYEAMGRNAGWIAAATALARREKEDAPHLIYMPETAFSRKQFVEDCKEVLSRYGRVFIVAAEGLKDKDGNYITAATGEFAKDSFGHVQLGGVAEILRQIIESDVKVKARWNKLGTCQREAMHFASKTDGDEAYLCGQSAVKHAVEEDVTGKMVSLVRESDEPYRCTTGLVGVADVANAEKPVPREWINERGNFVTGKFIRYATPLIQGEVEVPIENGLPKYIRLQRKPIAKKCPPR